MVFHIKISFRKWIKTGKAPGVYKEAGRKVLNLRRATAASHLSIYFDEIVENPISARGTCDL